VEWSGDGGVDGRVVALVGMEGRLVAPVRVEMGFAEAQRRAVAPVRVQWRARLLGCSGM